MRRSSEEYIVMSLSYGGAVAILPFAIIRLTHGEWAVGLVDFVMVIGMFALGSIVYLSRTIGFSSMALSVLCLSGMSIVIHLKGPSLVFWAYPTIAGVYFVVAPRLAIMLTLVAALAIAPALAKEMEVAALGAVFMMLVVNSLFAYVFSTRMHNQRDQLSQLVRRDPLTGAGNRRALDEKLEELIALIKRTKSTASLLVIDIDYFKTINDNYGHSIGDQALIRITELINSRIRETDSLYRTGGEEFVVVAADTGMDAATGIAEQLRTSIDKTSLIDDIVVTISVGVAEFIKGEEGEGWLERADKALYQAKESGRNKTCIAS